MPLIFRYFWFVCAVFMAVNLVSWRSRFTTIVSRGSVTKAEADRFLRWAAVYLIAGPLVLGVIGLAAGWPSPFCASVLTFDTVPRALTSLLMLASWVSLLWWIWRGAGADFLARAGPALGKRPSYDKPYSPGTVRVVVTALVLVSAGGAAMMSRAMPPTPEFSCPAPNASG